MIKQILSEEFRRMQKLAGIKLNEDVSQEIQALIDKNDFLKGKVTATSSDIVEGDKFVLLFSSHLYCNVVLQVTRNLLDTAVCGDAHNNLSILLDQPYYPNYKFWSCVCTFCPR